MCETKATTKFHIGEFENADDEGIGGEWAGGCGVF